MPEYSMIAAARDMLQRAIDRYQSKLDELRQDKTATAWQIAYVEKCIQNIKDQLAITQLPEENKKTPE
jgi:hypothetical protein